MRRLQLGFVLFVSCLLLAATALSQVDWKEYRYPDDGFSVSAPSQPAVEKVDTQTAIGSVQNRTYAVQLSPDTGFMISASDFKQGDKVPLKTLLEGAKKGAAENSKSSITKELDASLDGNAGVEFELENQAYHSRVRCFFVNGKLLTIMAISAAGKPYPAGTDRFFNSLHLIKKPA